MLSLCEQKSKQNNVKNYNIDNDSQLITWVGNKFASPSMEFLAITAS